MPRRIVVYFRKNNQNRQSESWEMLIIIRINLNTHIKQSIK
ncbi:hypothetical protein CSB69_0005 [Morganella morganii]|nr:hypothetical protein CSB69_0005 [Morganella morganii]